MLFVMLTIPGHVYELFPVAVLIGTIVALVQMAASSELTVFRSSGASFWQMVGALFKIALPLVVLSFVCGELLAPPSERMAQQLRLKAQNAPDIAEGISFRRLGQGRTQLRECEKRDAGHQFVEY